MTEPNVQSQDQVNAQPQEQANAQPQEQNKSKGAVLFAKAKEASTHIQSTGGVVKDAVHVVKGVQGIVQTIQRIVILGVVILVLIALIIGGSIYLSHRGDEPQTPEQTEPPVSQTETVVPTPEETPENAPTKPTTPSSFLGGLKDAASEQLAQAKEATSENWDALKTFGGQKFEHLKAFGDKKVTDVKDSVLTEKWKQSVGQLDEAGRVKVNALLHQITYALEQLAQMPSQTVPCDGDDACDKSAWFYEKTKAFLAQSPEFPQTPIDQATLLSQFEELRPKARAHFQTIQDKFSMEALQGVIVAAIAHSQSEVGLNEAQQAAVQAPAAPVVPQEEEEGITAGDVVLFTGGALVVTTVVAGVVVFLGGVLVYGVVKDLIQHYEVAQRVRAEYAARGEELPDDAYISLDGTVRSNAPGYDSYGSSYGVGSRIAAHVFD